MEGVDHIDVIQIGGCRLVGEVYRMPQRQVPDRKCLEFGVAGLDAAAVLVIELGETGSHLSAAGTGSGHDDERSFGLDIIVSTVAFVAADARDVHRITGDGIVAVDFEPE